MFLREHSGESNGTTGEVFPWEHFAPDEDLSLTSRAVFHFLSESSVNQASSDRSTRSEASRVPLVTTLVHQPVNSI